MTPLRRIEDAARRAGLCVLGGFHPAADDRVPDTPGTLLLLGPDEPAFWPRFKRSPEMQDGAPDPLDRWSERVVTRLAVETGTTPLFPFGGPPWHPFYAWALRTGRVHASPTRLLVHDRAGLWVSFRGALALASRIDLPPPPPSPCDTCAAKPCLSACPVDAFAGGAYDVPACKAHVAAPQGRPCRAGCRVRALCPVSAAFGRDPEQSAFHMTAFTG